MTENSAENGRLPNESLSRESRQDWERNAMERILLASIDEQRKARRWGIFFKLFFVAYLVLILILAQSSGIGEKPAAGNFTALVDLEGVIAPGRTASADNIISGLRKAFESKAKAVIIRANSPGGTTVQSAYISDEVRRLKKKYPDKPVYGVISDVCASGCYYIISGVDKIYANPSSIVGSIGVLLDGGFGFTKVMKKIGVERRLFTAGQYKGSFDPFSPLKPGDKRSVEKMLREVHQQFITAVRSGRGKTLKETKDTFSGRFWSGETAKKMGLVDEFGSSSFVAREVVGADKIVDFTYRPGWLDRFATKLGASVGGTLITSLRKSNVSPTQ
ncbi:MAG: S49 family peptidase [Acidiferrobacterales bacterium]